MIVMYTMLIISGLLGSVIAWDDLKDREERKDP